jgi:Ca-activated chloride channel homolog
VVGLQVDPRARRQLQCIAKAGGGSYVDVQDADKLGEELAAALARAFRTYDPSGTKVTGGTTQDQPTSLSTGLYQDVITPYGQRWYAIDVPAGRRLVTSVTEITSIKAEGAAEFHVRLLDPQGQVVQLDSELIQGRDSVSGRAQTFSPRMEAAGGGRLPAGRYLLMVEIAQGTAKIDPIDIPVELGIQLLKPGEDPGLVRIGGAIPAPKPSPTATPKATVDASSSSDGGSDTSWPLVIGVALAGLLLGLAAAAVLGRRRTA